MRNLNFEVEVSPLASEDGVGFIALVPELPGCRSDGETPHDALRNAYDAIACWIEAARELGCDIPEPRRAAA